jgi:hypothetical protein
MQFEMRQPSLLVTKLMYLEELGPTGLLVLQSFKTPMFMRPAATK